jgi:hypothetical protein
MRCRFQTRIAFCTLVLSTIGTSFTFGREPKRNTPRFDGNWWLSVTSEEQIGYLNGDADCIMTELGIQAKSPRSAEEDKRFITDFYTNNESLRSETVTHVHRKAWAFPPAQKAKGGEVWHESHGYWDGDWWTQSSPRERLGFVEGYLRCYLDKPSKSRATFSRPPSYYVEQINAKYRVNDPPPIPIEIIEEKIASVLLNLHDPA